MLPWEGVIPATNGLGRERALETATLGAARILGVDDRVGSTEIGKDADLVLFDGDPFESTSHVCGVIIEPEVSPREFCWASHRTKKAEDVTAMTIAGGRDEPPVDDLVALVPPRHRAKPSQSSSECAWQSSSRCLSDQWVSVMVQGHAHSHVNY